MTSRDFCFWLQGFFEIAKAENAGITPEQSVIIKNHLNLVFVHEIAPTFGNEEAQKKLNEVHTPAIKLKPAADGNIMRC